MTVIVCPAWAAERSGRFRIASEIGINLAVCDAAIIARKSMEDSFQALRTGDGRITDSGDVCRILPSSGIAVFGLLGRSGDYTLSRHPFIQRVARIVTAAVQYCGNKY
jgi:hypothetical protein